MNLVRRKFLHLAGAAIAAPAVSRIAWGQAPAAGQPLAGKGLIVGRPVPLTAEAPLEGITTWITPNDRFPILTSIAQTYPAIEAADWQLTVEGLVEQPLTLTYAQLRSLPVHRVTAIVECAGNSRNSVSPPLARSHLSNGYVGNAEWTGVPLRAVLEQAGLKPATVEIVLEGADRGKPPFAATEVNFAKSVPVEKALHPDTLLIYEMNGTPLPREYGGPVRALVPGWYGTYQVKWLKRVEATDRTFDGVFMTRIWRVRRKHNGFLRDEPVSQIAVKSLITSPAPGARLSIGAQVIRGVAWSGGKDVTSVRVTTDAGATWQFARLLDPHAPYAWRLWELPWRPSAPGSHTLMARATDTSGAAQPLAYDFDLNGFEVNQVQAVKVEVTA
jgi:DMSO/TMAO reductase YedYZ molybdopterin-dependent catalytic subunit